MTSPEQVTDRVERLVIGADFGADGYTTADQADDLAHRLALRPGRRLLDLGSGHGWPGVYLAIATGCRVTLTDPHADGLRNAVARCRREGLTNRCAAVAATGSHLPFATGTFDAVTHTDVLCCLTAKLAMLTECRRVLRHRGRMAFHTIFVVPGLSDVEHRRAVRCGPPAVAAADSYHRLLRTAGFADHDEIDVTAAYLDTARAWLRHQREHAAELASLGPTVALDDQLARRQAAVSAIEAGLLHRSLFVATRDHREPSYLS